ncbi:MAG TPA: PA0069 family radical SAM protein [Tepidisphaeraceae bacterium]|jgi:DNA repair photolyase|nr:PA0069 family radical SAM protein [Tepidisphaeraceae bacterium]
MHPVQLTIQGRGTAANPPNRFEPIAFEIDGDYLDDEEQPAPQTAYFKDTARSIIAHNDSPDVGFTWSINAYRGCSHGCIYCYARPTHEYFGLSAGLDFETKIFVKEDAPALLREALYSPKWQPATLAMSGVTDCYQPIERQLQITRRCLQVLAEFRNPVGIITKSHLVTRDIDVLQNLSAVNAAMVFISITTLDADISAKMEPRAASPKRRMAAVEALAAAGIPVGVMVAPIIPGLTDHEMPQILKAAADVGAGTAGYTTVRLPFAVKDLFQEWLGVHFPDRKEKILNRIRDLRGGKLNDSNFNTRMRGQGVFADQFSAMFKLAKRRAGLDKPFPKLSTAAFSRPVRAGDQLMMF